MDTILLATDGSEYARRAGERAVDLAAERNARLCVICVVDSQRFEEPALSSAELSTIYAEDGATTCVTEVTDLAAARGVPVEGVTRHGVPHEVIFEYAGEVDADVIVIGEHGDHAGHFSGVGRRVRERADREVVVVGAGSTVAPRP